MISNIISLLKGVQPVGQIEKRLRALSEGKDLPWTKVVTLLEHYGANVQTPNSGSHFKVFIKGKPPLIVPVHNGRIKKVYAAKIAEYLNEFIN